LNCNEARDDGVALGSGISWTICKSFAPRCRKITTAALHHSPEGMDTGASARPLSSESEGDSLPVSSGKEEVLLVGSSEKAAVEAEPKIQDHAESDTRGSKETAAGLKCKTRVGPRHLSLKRNN